MMLGLGVGIDYALFILARHRQNLASGQSVPVAIGRANATAGLSVLFAGRHGHRRDPRAQGVRHPDDVDDGLRLGDHGRRHDAGLHHAAAGDARCRQAPREQCPGAVHQAEAGVRPRRQVGTVGGSGRRPAGSVRRCSGADPRHPRRPGLLDAPGLRRRGQRRPGLDDPQGLRPDGRRLRPRHQRSARGGPRHQRRHDLQGDHHRRVRGPGGRARRRLGGPGGDQRRSRHRDHRGHPDHVTAGRPHRPAARAPACRTRFRRRSTARRSRPR